MPQAIPVVGAVAGGLTSHFVSAAIGGVAGTIVGAVAGGIVSVGVSYLGQKAFAPDKPKLQDQSLMSAEVKGGGRTQMVRQPITAHRIVYGETRVSGPIVFIHSRPASASSDKLDMLHVVIVLAAHESETVGDIYFNNDLVALDGNGDATAAPYKENGTVYASVYKHLGTDNQTADTVLVDNTDGKWTTAHRGRGHTYIHAMLRWSDTAYASGLPNISALVKGKKVYDPRDQTTGWSDNPALCIMDYLMAGFGLGAGLDEIDKDSFIAAANICDETVQTIDGTEKRYTCNGVVDLADNPRTILEDMLSSCAGFLTYTGGKWRIKVGAYVAPMFTVEEKHARQAVMYRPHRSRRTARKLLRPRWTCRSRSRTQWRNGSP